MMLRRSWLGSYEKYCDKRKVPLDGKKHSSYTHTHTQLSSAGESLQDERLAGARLPF